MSEHVPVDPTRANGATPDERRADPMERLAGLDRRPAADAAVWGPSARPTSPDANGSDPAPRPGLPPSTPRPPTPTVASSTAPPEASSPSTPVRIGRLSRVSGSDLWTDGSALAAWLAASPEPLSEALGKPPFEFASSGTNILLGTSADQQAVCVVCEVGPTTDEGLGVLLRVAAVQEGGLVVWVAGEAADPQVAALSWLNRTTSPRFFLVRVTGIQIDGSASAPIFELVARPPRAAGPAPVADPGRPTGSSDDVPRRRVEDHVPGV